ncbi:CD276 antigen homolog isoform X2 [Amia ocellicauda]|uniref:CD276 antigen homolog isoform X2 n=1 Tax=Amia ocellicauda TaxID=2972642 RepID=UPI0034642A4C
MPGAGNSVWIAFLLLPSIFLYGAETKILGFIGEDVILPCACKLNKHNIYLVWQIGESSVVDAFINGRPYTENQKLEFQNRTRLFVAEQMGNCSLQLSSVSAADEHTYTCYYEGTVIEQVVVSLEVAAHYSNPVLLSPNESAVADAPESYSCIATGGYPKGRIHWILNNSSLAYSRDNRRDVDSWDNATGTYSLSSTLNISLSRTDVLTCMVENSRLQVNISASKTFSRTDGGSPDSSADAPPALRIVILPAVVCCGFILGAILICLLMRKFNMFKTRDPSPATPAIGAERQRLNEEPV